MEWTFVALGLIMLVFGYGLFRPRLKDSWIFGAIAIILVLFGYCFEIADNPLNPRFRLMVIDNGQVIDWDRQLVTGWDADAPQYSIETKSQEYPYIIVDQPSLTSTKISLVVTYRLNQTKDGLQRYYDRFLKGGSSCELSFIAGALVNLPEAAKSKARNLGSKSTDEERFEFGFLASKGLGEPFKQVGLELIGVIATNISETAL